MAVGEVAEDHAVPTVVPDRQGVEVTHPMMLAVIDIVGSTVLARELGDMAYARLLEDFFRCIRSRARAHGADELAQTGDGFVHCYQSPPAALAATVEMFRANACLNQRRVAPLGLRGGMHRGRLIRSATRLTGLAFSEACELGQHSRAGEVWLSVEAIVALRGHLDRPSTELVSLPRSGWREVHSLSWWDARISAEELRGAS